MKKIISLFVTATLLLNNSKTEAQTTTIGLCYTESIPKTGWPTSMVALPCSPSPVATTDFNQFYKLKSNYQPVDGVGAPLHVDKTIKIVINVMNPPADYGYPKSNFYNTSADKDRIRAIVNRINGYLSSVVAPSPASAAIASHRVTDARFRVEITDIRFIESRNYLFENNFEWSSVGLGAYNGWLNSYLYQPDKVLNIFFMFTDLVTGPLGGVADGSYVDESDNELASGENNKNLMIVTENYYRTTDDDAVAKNLFHEIGHVMGTHHVFETRSEIGNEAHYDYCSDLYGSGSTKVFPRIKYSTDNFMDYSDGKHITPQQIARWNRNAHFLHCRKYVYNTWPEDINHSHVGQGQFRPHLITKNETWDFDIKMYNDIIVKSGNKLSIKCRVLMPYHANIIVEPGAELEIDGGIISSHNDTTMWYGISVWGDASKSQDIISDQGLITMKNGATISNALHAVMLADAVFWNSSRNGGIAHIENSHFINNRRSIGFHDYHNYGWEAKGGTWTRTWLRPNKSWIIQNTFEVNNNMLRDPKGQVTMSGVDGVTIKGCTFNTTMPYAAAGVRCSTGCPDQNAIVTWNASFLLDQFKTYPTASPIIPSQITGFKNGVLAQSFGVTNNFTVLNTKFDNNTQGVLSRAVNNFTVKNNQFIIGNPEYIDDPCYGLNLRSSSFYNVYYNSFERKALSGITNNQVGVMVFEGGQDNNAIRNNTYQKLYIGNLSDKQNTNLIFDPLVDKKSKGLQFLCNNYAEDIFFSQYLNGTDPSQHGMCYIQGEESNPAGNIFNATYPILSQSDIAVRLTGAGAPVTHPINKYYYSTFTLPERPFSVSGYVTTIGRSFESQCAITETSTGGGDGSGSGSGSATAFAAAAMRLADAYNDFSVDRPTLLNNALADMHSPYAEIERALLKMQYGEVAQGLGIYYAIAATMPLTAQEQNDFVQGATLMRIIADKYAQSNTPNFADISNSQADSIRYVRDHSKMWAYQRACAWLGYALDEHCALPALDIPNTNNNGGNMRKTEESIVAEEANYLTVNPNPSKANFELQYSIDGDAAIIVSDMMGRKIVQAMLSSKEHSYIIKAAEWASGVYLYQVSQNGKNLYNGKLIKQ